MSRPADEEMIGRNVAGKFVVEKFLGGGAMGAVYKAYQKSIEKHVAIKVLHKEFGAEASFVSRFEREAKAASLLDHVNLMRVIDYGREPDGVCYIAMELLEGRSLFQVIKEDSPLPPNRIAGLIRQALAGLAVAHEQGIIHRDLKPENIVVLEKSDDDGNRAELVKVCDFGMAKLVTPDAEVEGSGQGPLSSEKLTSHGVVVGTPDYMSPEQGKGERLDARSDIYAVGVILYQMLTRRLPFSAETPIATLLRHVIDDPLPPSDIDPDVHSGLESICLRALAKHRDDRFQTAREMRQEVRAVMEGRGAGMQSALPPPRLTLGSMPEAAFDGLNLRAAGVPTKIDSGADFSHMDLPGQTPRLTPPQSLRIRAVEVLRDDGPPPRRWTAPLAVALLLGVAGATFFGIRHRRAELRASPPPAVALAVASTSVPAATTSATPQPPSTGEAPVEAARPVPESKGATYLTPASQVVAVRGLSHPEPTATSASVASPVPAGPAFGVLAVPEVPKIAGAGEPGPAPVPAPALSASAAPPDPFEHAKVAVGAVHADKVAASDVIAALPTSRFDRCYRKGLASRGSAVSGTGSLHLAIDSMGHVGSASFAAGSTDLTSIGQCIAEAAIGRDIKHVEAGATGADVDLAFKAE